MLIDIIKKLALLIVPSLGAREKYRPERHYMRGPGPKSEARGSKRIEPDQMEA